MHECDDWRDGECSRCEPIDNGSERESDHIGCDDMFRFDRPTEPCWECGELFVPVVDEDGIEHCTNCINIAAEDRAAAIGEARKEYNDYRYGGRY